MKTALVAVEFPYGKSDQLADEQKRYHEFLADAKKRAENAIGIEELDQNVWLIDVRSGQQFLAWLVSTTTQLRRPVRVMYLDHDGWIKL